MERWHFEIIDLKIYSKNFNDLSWILRKECNVQHFFAKNHVLRGFSGTAHELMVMRKPPNANPRPQLMQKEPTDLLNLPRRKSHFPVETLMLCYSDVCRISFYWGLAHGRFARWHRWSACDVGEATEELENKLWRRWSYGRVGEWAEPPPQPLSPLHLHHSSFSNPYVASPMSQLIL